MVDIVLKDYQLRAIDEWVTKKRAYVAYPTGSGKTLVAIEGLKRIKPERALVVCPAKVVPQWKRELSAHGVVADVTSYNLLKGKSVAKYDAIVFDEAHALKNRKSGVSKCAATLCKNSQYVLMMSATPNPNRPADIWHPLHCLYGYRVAGSWSRFIEYWTECTYWESVPTPGKLKREMHDEFAQYVAQYMCLESASNILDLPTVNYVLKEYVESYEPTLYFTWERARAEWLAKTHQIDFIHGGQTIKKRLSIIENAIKDHKSVVATVGSIGEGIDGLQYYQRACFLQLVWSPGKLVQAVGRIVRLGSKHKEVTVEFVVPKGSRQERMAYLLKQKLTDNAAIYGDEDAMRVANDILGGEMTDEQFDAMASNLTADLIDFG